MTAVTMDLLDFLSTPQPRPPEERLQALLDDLETEYLEGDRELLFVWLVQSATNGRFRFKGRLRTVARQPLPEPDDAAIFDLLTDLEPGFVKGHGSTLGSILQEACPEVCAAALGYAREAEIDQFFPAWFAVTLADMILEQPEWVPDVLALTDCELVLPNIARVFRKRLASGGADVARVEAILALIAAIGEFGEAYARAVLGEGSMQDRAADVRDVVLGTLRLAAMRFRSIDSLIELVRCHARIHLQRAVDGDRHVGQQPDGSPASPNGLDGADEAPRNRILEERKELCPAQRCP